MKPIVFIIISFFISPIILIAQKNTTKINLINPNLDELRYETFKAVNELRIQAGHTALIWDAVLLRAAQDHANYLLPLEYLSHQQHKEATKTPNNRVKIHGGFDYIAIGENIVTIQLGTEYLSGRLKHNSQTYTSAAKSMALLWKKSPGHYKNIISKKYKQSAIGLAYDSRVKKLVAVQVFGFTNTPIDLQREPDKSEYLMTKSIPDIPYKLKNKKLSNRNKKAIPYFMALDLDRGFITCDYKNAKRAFRGKKSGLTFEILSREMYDKHSKLFDSIPNRRNGLFPFNGTPKEPIFKKELLRYSKNHNSRYILHSKLLKIKKKPEHFIYPMPYKSDSNTEINIFLVNNRNLVSSRLFVGIPWSFFDVDFPTLNIDHDLNSTIQASQLYKNYSKYDTLSIRIFYESAKSEISTTKQEEIKQALTKSEGKIIAINAVANASVEGNKTLNKKIATERLQNFQTFVNPWLDTTTIKPKFKIREQWSLFGKQIENTAFKHLYSMKIDEIRSFVNINKSDTLLKQFLDEQRYTDFRLVRRVDIKEPVFIKQNAKSDYESILKGVNQIANPRRSILNKLEKAQVSYYRELILDGKEQQDVLPALSLDKYPQLKYNELVFKFNFAKTLSAREFHTSLRNIGLSKYFPNHLRAQIVYNNMVAVYQMYFNGTLIPLLGEKMCPKKVKQDFFFQRLEKVLCSRSNTEATSYHVLKSIPKFIKYDARINRDKNTDLLWKYYHENLIEYYANKIPMDKRLLKLLPGFRRHFHPNNSALTNKQRLKYALFYCSVKEYRKAKHILEPVIKEENPTPQALKLYICLKNEDFEQSHEYINFIIDQLPKLGKKEWCDLWIKPEYLSFTYLEDLKLKNIYQCNCLN